MGYFRGEDGLRVRKKYDCFAVQVSTDSLECVVSKIKPKNKSSELVIPESK